jgi:hypothetical protein
MGAPTASWTAGDRRGGVAEAMSSAVDESPCPQCGEPVSKTVGSPEDHDQLAAPSLQCPACGAALVRAIDGHADLGWRLAEEA